MKNLLRKFHIGNNRDDQSSETSAPFAGISEWFSSVTRVNQSSASINQASNGLENSGGTAERTNGGDLAARAEVSPSAKPDYHSLEEEYQVQLAMALSVSNNDIVDPETAEIEAVKRISLGLYPNPNASTSQAEVVAYRYWAYNVLNYDDKVVDGFYDIYGVICDPGAPEKMPLLIDLQGAPVSDSVSCEVVLVNRATDPALAKLEQTAMGLVASCGASKTSILRSTLAQKIAELVAEHMGGSVRSDVEMLKAWRKTSAELRESSQNNVLPLGYLRVGLARHRALLFKVLADCVGIPCRLVKGRHYTGVDEGAVNIIKDVDDREYIIDLMGAPGALIPPDVPGGNPLEHVATKMAISASPAEIEQVKAGVPEVNLGGRHHSEPCELTDALAGSERRFHVRSPSWTEGVGSPAVRQMKVKDMSHFMIDAARDNPGLAQKLHDVLLESGVVAPPDLFSEISPKQLQSQHAQVEEMRRSDRNRNNRVTRSKDKGKPPLGAPKGSSYCHDYSTKERLQRLNSVEGLGERRPLEQSLLAVGGSPIVSAAAAASVLNAVQENFPPELIKHVPVAASAITAAVVASSMVVAAAKAESNDPSLEVPITAATATATAAVVAATSAAAVLRSETGSGKGVSGNGNRKTSCNEEGNRRKGSSSSDVEPEEKTSGKSDKSSGRADSVMEDAAEWEIPWEELVIGDRIGLGSYGEVYRGDWHGTEVAIKKFLDQDISGDALDEFITEVRLMTRMRHPNVVLFMGAVTRPPNLSIVTEFLPRGSLYKLIHRSNHQLDERRRLRMALDVAKGMNYLHSSTPIIVHRDLKSPNLLVDKNWVVKVCDFGLSRMKHHTFLSSKSQAGTPEWMAPEVLRNEPSNEKADVYSFGVILWELATLQEPWHGMNPMQVVGAVGFQHRRLEIPPDMDPQISKIILECWHNDSNFRPSFAQLMTRLRPFLRPVITSQDPVKQRSRQHQPHQQQQQPQAVSRQEVAAAVTSAADDEQSKI